LAQDRFSAGSHFTHAMLSSGMPAHHIPHAHGEHGKPDRVSLHSYAAVLVNVPGILNTPWTSNV